MRTNTIIILLALALGFMFLSAAYVIATDDDGGACDNADCPRADCDGDCYGGQGAACGGGGCGSARSDCGGGGCYRLGWD